ncbi:MBL fold metallo-hydrolase [Rhodococcus pyridinivorans]|uniref:MBL fold metallo-hydrolase n=1 Tax=Rhodococcus pyridinivorans TaxID=103816 RepID=UPI0020786445|nr:MBL fold metallo-hydrolase [Rhodococcus pyridinivorans]USI92983.1 MBL fold metallo-hydrolase [Rhodococcus pyridinivorans]
MILKQFYLECLSHASYLVGDETTGRAVVVDPRRDISEYLAEAETKGLRIEAVINTHFHADFVSGHLEFAAATSAWIGFGEAAETDYPIRRLRHGDHIRLGQVDIEVLSTPGHTWESISLLLREHGDAAPTAVLTGDSLFIGDVGRPDLANLGGGTNTDLARAMYRTVHQVLLPLPDDVLVMPAHGAGSSCGKNLSSDLVSTIGEQRRTNPSVQPMPEDDFVALVTSGQPAIPNYFRTDAVLNKSIRMLFDRTRTVEPLSASAVETELNSPRTVILDTRAPEDYADAHLKGSINVGLDGRFAETCGMVIDVGDRIVLVTAPGEETEAAMRLARIGYDNVIGSADLAVDTDEPFADFTTPIESTHRVGVMELDALLKDSRITLLDVRNPGERAAGHIDGSFHIPLPELVERHGGLPNDKPIVVHCRSGWRSSVAASLLRSLGYTRTTDLVGGYIAWADERRQTSSSCMGTSGD